MDEEEEVTLTSLVFLKYWPIPNSQWVENFEIKQFDDDNTVAFLRTYLQKERNKLLGQNLLNALNAKNDIIIKWN